MNEERKRVFISGNEATAEGGIAGGCRHFFGYPITPQNKIPEYMAEHLPPIGGVYLQAESEVAAINMVRGGPGLGNVAVAQSDYWLSTRGAGHGDGRCITLTPYSVQELHDFTAGAFEIADRYQNIVMVLGDAILASMMEPCELIPRR